MFTEPPISRRFSWRSYGFRVLRGGPPSREIYRSTVIIGTKQSCASWVSERNKKTTQRDATRAYFEKFPRRHQSAEERRVVEEDR